MSDTKEKTCAELLCEQRDSRIEQFDTLFEIVDNEAQPGDEEGYTSQEVEAAMEEVCNDVLSVDFQECEEYGDHLQFVLSTGGPADAFLAYVDHEGEVYKIAYQYQDWDDGAIVNLYGNAKATALRVVDVLGFDCPETVLDLIQTQNK